MDMHEVQIQRLLDRYQEFGEDELERRVALLRRRQQAARERWGAEQRAARARRRLLAAGLRREPRPECGEPARAALEES